MRKNLLIIPLLFLTVLVMAQTSVYTPSPIIKIGQQISTANIQIYPNPAVNFIGINELSGVSSIIIYNLVGRKMKNFIAQKGEKYNVSDLPKGIYLVQLMGNKGKVITTQRLSKK